MTFHLPRDLHRDDSDDEEETLSLCEFSINSSSDSQNSSFKSSSTQEDDDSACFEFFSEEWNATTLTHDDHRNQKSSSFTSNNNTIIFCGKFIPSKEPAVSKKIQKIDKIKSTSSKQTLDPSFTSSAPSKWYLFFFGITNFRTKMELRDIKMRQSRSRRSSSFQSSYSADNEMVNSTCMAKNKGGALAAMLRTLSCGSSGDHRAADVTVRPFSTGGSISKPSGVKSISRLLCMA